MSKQSHADNMPVGLAMAMAQDILAMKHFGILSEMEQEKIIAMARNAHSKEQMQHIVEGLADETLPH